MSDVLILIGTVTGNAEHVALALAEVFAYEGYRPALLDMYDAAPDVVKQYEQVLICTSTSGDGELPADAEDFYQALQALSPDLRGTQFAVCALGDRSYDPFFCEAGKMFERLLIQLGATPVVARFEIDGGPTAADIAQAQRWALNLVDTLHGIPA